MRALTPCAAALSLLTTAAACGTNSDRDGDASSKWPAVAAECNPMGGLGCVAPWPSALYQVPAATATGVRLDFPAGALPVNRDGVPIDPDRFHAHDGFSPASFAFTAFPVAVDPATLVDHTEIERSLTDSSPTVLVDMVTGERVAHFAEIDVNVAIAAPAQQAVYIRPATRLAAGGRYAVAIKKTLRDREGGELPRPPAFAAVIAGEPTDHARFEQIRSRYSDIFATLSDIGIAPEDLVVAWDFDVASDDMLTRDLLAARDQALAFSGTRGEHLAYEVTRDETPESPDSPLARLVEGTFSSPLFLTTDDGTGALARDGNGTPVRNGASSVRWVAMVPRCTADQAPLPMVVYGHSFFGDLNEATSDFVRQLAESWCVVIVGTVWRGMSRSDLGDAASALTDASGLVDFGERILQGIVDHIALAQLARGPLASDLLPGIADPDQLFFYGISQGAVLGATFVACDPSITRAALAVGGSNWSLLFERSTHWPTFQLIIDSSYGSGIDVVVIESLMQLGFDRVENLHVVGKLDGDPSLPGAPRKQMLLQMAVGDSQVSNLASELQAREMGVPMLAPSVRPSYGIALQKGALSSALAVYDESPQPLPPHDNRVNGTDNGTHRSARELPAATRQVGQFLHSGHITNTCAGACDCAAGACQ